MYMTFTLGTETLNFRIWDCRGQNVYLGHKRQATFIKLSFPPLPLTAGQTNQNSDRRHFYGRDRLSSQKQVRLCHTHRTHQPHMWLSRAHNVAGLTEELVMGFVLFCVLCFVFQYFLLVISLPNVGLELTILRSTVTCSSA